MGLARKNKTTMEYINIVIFCVAWIVNFTLFWRNNRNFKRLFPKYEGKMLWSLLFFPLASVVFVLYGILLDSLSLIEPGSSETFISEESMTSHTVMCIIIRGLGGVIMIALFNRLNELLYNKQGFYVEDIKPVLQKFYLTFSLIIIILSILEYNFIKDNEWQIRLADWNALKYYSSFLSGLMIVAIIQVAIVYIIYYLSVRKLMELTSLLGFNKTSAPHFTDQSKEVSAYETSFDKLQQIKKLYDSGILSEDEFLQMKKEILDKGI